MLCLIFSNFLLSIFDFAYLPIIVIQSPDECYILINNIKRVEKKRKKQNKKKDKKMPYYNLLRDISCL
jgi:hypothetical protein